MLCYVVRGLHSLRLFFWKIHMHIILSTLVLSKIVIATSLLVLLHYIWQTARHGRRLAYIKRDDFFNRILYEQTLSRHNWYVRITYVVALITVALVEITVRNFEAQYDLLFWIHLLFFAIPCFVTLTLLRFKYTGLKRPDIHGKLIYWGFLPALIGTLLTGIPLLYRL